VAGLASLMALGIWMLAARDPKADASAPAGVDAPELDALDRNVAANLAESGGPHSVKDFAASPKIDHAVRFRAATNYFDFVRETRPAALAGDVRAQVYLYRALKSCSVDYQYLFKSERKKRYLTYEEGVQEAMKRLPFRPEYVPLVYARCHGLFDPLDPDVENPVHWLRRAAQGMDPLALALATGRVLVTSETATQTNAAELRLDQKELDQQKATLGRRQLGSALRSRDPEVIFEIAEVIHLSGAPDADRETISAEWRMAACLRGLDCSSSSEIVRGFCLWDRDCQPYESLPDVLHRHVGAGFPAVEARAREINALIDAGKWEELGFGETISDP
jgi:hypothetical protein